MDLGIDMSYDECKQAMINRLTELTEYSTSMLEQSAPDPRKLRSKPRYLSALFPMSLSYTQGIKLLTEKDQPRNAIILLRSSQELWFNTFLIYSTRSDIWLWHTLLKDEVSNFKKATELHADGHMSSEQLKTLSKQLDSLKNFVYRKYDSLPLVDGVITERSNGLDKHLSLKDKCRIIDRSNVRSPDGLFEKQYATVYSFFSETAHGTSRGMNSVYFQNEDSLELDIYGTKGQKQSLLVIETAYLYHYDLLKIYCDKIATKIKIPDSIKESRDTMKKYSKQLANAKL